MSIQTAPRTAFAGAAVALVGALIAIYVVSQFLRNSIGVIAPNLAVDLGLNAAEIGLLSSTFFFVFAAVQIPVGMALDRFGPRLCLLVGAAVTMIGAIVFASAPTPGMLILGRALLGLGTSGSLVASLAVYARRFPPNRFATLTGLQVGLGTVGTLLATAPLAYSTAAIGWRGSFLAVAVGTLVIAAWIAVVVRGHGVEAAGGRGSRAHGHRETSHKSSHETWRESLAGIVEVMRIPSVGRLFVMNLVMYSSFALVAGLWGGPYLTHIYGFSLEQRGNMLLIPVLAQIVGATLWGPTDRLIGSHKLPVLIGAGLTAAALGYLGRRWQACAIRADRLVRAVRIGGGLLAGADRARQGAVPAAPGWPRPDGAEHGCHGRDLPGPGSQRMCDRFVPHSARRGLRARCLSFGLRPAGRIHSFGVNGLSWIARSDDGGRAEVVPHGLHRGAAALHEKGSISLTFPLALCALRCMLLRCGSASRYRRPPWAFPP
jgi:MFS family permease